MMETRLMGKPRVVLTQEEAYYHVVTRTAQKAFHLEEASFKRVLDDIVFNMA